MDRIRRSNAPSSDRFFQVPKKHPNLGRSWAVNRWTHIPSFGASVLEAEVSAVTSIGEGAKVQR